MEDAGIPAALVPEKLPKELFESAEFKKLLKIPAASRIFSGEYGADARAVVEQIDGGFNVPNGTLDWHLSSTEQSTGGLTLKCKVSAPGTDRIKKWARA